MKKIIITKLVVLFIISITSSTVAQKNKLENPFETNGNLDSQFNYLYKTSTNYKEYKVISKKGYSQLHKNVLDSIANHKNLQTVQHIENQNQLSEIKKLNDELTVLQEDLKNASLNKNSIIVFGISIYKTNYNLIIAIILMVLLGLAGFFFYKFTDSNTVTKKANRLLEEAQQELESVQKSALKRQQELNRKLQDERLKNSKG